MSINEHQRLGVAEQVPGGDAFAAPLGLCGQAQRVESKGRDEDRAAKEPKGHVPGGIGGLRGADQQRSRRHGEEHSRAEDADGHAAALLGHEGSDGEEELETQDALKDPGEKAGHIEEPQGGVERVEHRAGGEAPQPDENPTPHTDALSEQSGADRPDRPAEAGHDDGQRCGGFSNAEFAAEELQQQGGVDGIGARSPVGEGEEANDGPHAFGRHGQRGAPA
jgi:hypothetical protein